MAAAGVAFAATATGLVQLLMGYGVVFGTGGGVGYILCQQGVNMLVQRRRGLVNGYIVSLYPLGAMIATPAFHACNEAFGWRTTLGGLATVLLAAWNLSGPLAGHDGGLPLTGLRLSVGFLVVTVVFGVVYAFDRQTGWFPLLPNRVLAHAHLGLLGWLGLTYVSVAEKLWPMFLLAHRPRARAGAWGLASAAVDLAAVSADRRAGDATGLVREPAEGVHRAAANGLAADGDSPAAALRAAAGRDGAATHRRAAVGGPAGGAGAGAVDIGHGHRGSWSAHRVAQALMQGAVALPSSARRRRARRAA